MPRRRGPGRLIAWRCVGFGTSRRPRIRLVCDSEQTAVLGSGPMCAHVGSIAYSFSADAAAMIETRPEVAHKLRRGLEARRLLNNVNAPATRHIVGARLTVVEHAAPLR